jgi:hypothetical protein
MLCGGMVGTHAGDTIGVIALADFKTEKSARGATRAFCRVPMGLCRLSFAARHLGAGRQAAETTSAYQHLRAGPCMKMERIKLELGEGLGKAKPQDKKEEFLSQIINRLNEVFVTDQLTDKDMVNYAYTSATRWARTSW